MKSDVRTGAFLNSTKGQEKIMGDESENDGRHRRHDPVTFVVAVNNEDVFRLTFMESPALRSWGGKIRILKKEGYPSASIAYNKGLDDADTDLVVFVHQDVFLPEIWMEELMSSLRSISSLTPNVGVVGCYGVDLENRRYGHLYSTGLGAIIGEPIGQPMPVRTLDEIILILRKSSGLRFDENLPGFHLYGTDICMEASRRGLINYAVGAFCIHNSNEAVYLPDQFYRCYRYLRRKYWNELPIQTSCIRITKGNSEYIMRKLKGFIARIQRRKGRGRSQNPADLWEKMKYSVSQ